VNEYREKYKIISQLPDKNPQLVSLVHQDLAKMLSQSKRVPKSKYTSEQILRRIRKLSQAMRFAMGNYVGIRIVEKLSLGVVLIRVLTKKDASGLIKSFKSANYGVTSVDGHGA